MLQRTDIALGEALFAGANAFAMWGELVKTGAVSGAQAAEALDRMTLIFEQMRATMEGSEAAIDHAIFRMNALRDGLAKSS